MKNVRWLVLGLVALLAGCGKPVPPEKAAYVGEWQSASMALVITQDGKVAYKRVKGSSTTSVNGPIQKFEGNNFVVGIPYLTTTFEVSKPPFQQQDGRWKMVVDGVELTRAR
jgi:hypothetical protein